jgi:hypothetical protein
MVESVNTKEKKMLTRYAMTNAVERVVRGDEVVFCGLSVGGRPFGITTKLSDANEWLNGGLIQNCFPYLSADEREILMTGLDKQDWDDMFGEEEDAE